MTIVYGVLYGLFGLVVGSFLNVCIYRIPRRIFWQDSHSFCPHCGSALKWYDMIPVLSWIILRGRCRTCHERISPRYPLVEAGNALLWALSYVTFGLGWYSAVLCVLFSLLLVGSCIDLDIMELPNGIVIAIAVLGIAPFVASFFEGSGLPGNLPWWGYLVGIAAASVPLFLVALVTRGGIGGGDVKLLAAVGFFAGWKLVLMGTLFGVVLGAIMAIVLMIAFGRTRKAMLPLVPALSLGLVVALLWGDAILGRLGLI